MIGLLKSFGFPFKPSIRINSKESLENAARSLGILPFFPNNIKGLSVEELCAPGMLFGGNYDEGCWEWKGPVIRKRTTAYGKFFRRKAGFVSLELLPEFLNFRRSVYPIKSGTTDEMLLEIIKENDSLSSTELKALIFGGRKRRDWTDLPDSEEYPLLKSKSKSIESPLQRLQMGGWIVISDFEYKQTKRGERYGWGVARYSTPELLFGDLLENSTSLTPEESFSNILDYLKKRIPGVSKQSLEQLLK